MRILFRLNFFKFCHFYNDSHSSTRHHPFTQRSSQYRRNKRCCSTTIYVVSTLLIKWLARVYMHIEFNYLLLFRCKQYCIECVDVGSNIKCIFFAFISTMNSFLYSFCHTRATVACTTNWSCDESECYSNSHGTLAKSRNACKMHDKTDGDNIIII